MNPMEYRGYLLYKELPGDWILKTKDGKKVSEFSGLTTEQAQERVDKLIQKIKSLEEHGYTKEQLDSVPEYKVTLLYFNVMKDSINEKYQTPYKVGSPQFKEPYRAGADYIIRSIDVWDSGQVLYRIRIGLENIDLNFDSLKEIEEEGWVIDESKIQYKSPNNTRLEEMSLENGVVNQDFAATRGVLSKVAVMLSNNGEPYSTEQELKDQLEGVSIEGLEVEVKWPQYVVMSMDGYTGYLELYHDEGQVYIEPELAWR